MEAPTKPAAEKLKTQRGGLLEPPAYVIDGAGGLCNHERLMDVWVRQQAGEHMGLLARSVGPKPQVCSIGQTNERGPGYRGSGDMGESIPNRRHFPYQT